MKNKGLIIALVATCIAFFIVAQRKKKDENQTDNNGVVGEDINLAGGVETTSNEEGKGKNNKDSEVVVSNLNETAPAVDDIGFLKQEVERKVTQAWEKYLDDTAQGIGSQSVRVGVGQNVRFYELQEYLQALQKEYGCSIVFKTNGRKITKLKIDF
jgi:hypothetical protein